MALAPKTVRAQLTLLKPFLAGSSLKAIRKGQNTIGEMMEAQYRQEVVIRSHAFDLLFARRPRLENTCFASLPNYIKICFSLCHN